MNILYKILKQDPDSREGIITTTSTLQILCNLFIALTKVIVGVIASSIAIISEGVNNAADALTSILTLIGTKLAGKHPDEKHPFGYGRIEYLTSLIISILILVSGYEMLTSSIDLIIHPEEINISYLSLTIVAIFAVVKFLLGTYTIKMGKKADSGSLEAVGMDCRNDSYISLITIVSSLVFLIKNVSIDAYAGFINSALILKAGIEVLMDTISELLGRPGEEELAAKLYHEIRNTEGIINAVDMMLHNYGPGSYSGSVNVEIDHNKTVGEVYNFLHALQLKIMHEYHVTMVFGIYAIDNDNELSREIRYNIANFVRNHDEVKSYHAVYKEPNTKNLYCDLIVSYKLQNWDDLEKEFKEYMHKIYPENNVILTIETEYV